MTIKECEEGSQSFNKVCKDKTGGYRGSCDGGSLNYYYLNGEVQFIDANGSNRSNFEAIPETLTASGFCDYYENEKDKKKLLASYYRRTTKNQVLVPFLVYCLENGSERTLAVKENYFKALQKRALAVFNTMKDIVRVSVLEYKPMGNKNDCRLGCFA